MKIGRLEFKIKHIENNIYRLSIKWVTRKELERVEKLKRVEHIKKVLKNLEPLSQRNNNKL